MEVERRIEQLVGRKLVLELPQSFENQQVEVIVLTLEPALAPPAKRRPHPSLAGTMSYDDDLFDSVPLSDFEILR